MRRHLLMQFVVVAVAFAWLTQSSAQTSLSAAKTHKLTFDVASVRENKSGGRPTSNVPLDRGGQYSPTGGVFSATNQSVITLIIFAYKMKLSETLGGFMRKLPGWAVTDRFDINARAASANPTKDEMRLMVQSLLEDRFRLKVHRENQEMPVFGMYLRKPGEPGPQLKPHAPSSSCTSPLPPPPAGIPVEKLVGLWPPTCGDGDEESASRKLLREGGRDMTMSAIADHLTGVGDSARAIQDRTGLGGTFDYVYEFDPESVYGDNLVPRGDSGPTFAEALKEQLGLQLKKQDGVVSIFVVDNIAYPLPN